MLVERYQTDKLLDLDTIDLGFIRPRSPLEWQQAYLQAQLYVEYIEKKHGPESIGKLLAAFAKGRGVPAALKEVCGVERPAFEKGYKAYLGEVVKKLRGAKAPAKRRTEKELRAALDKDDTDPDANAELALRLLYTKRAEARKLAEKALEKKKDHPKALYVLAMLARRAADTKQEKALLDKALDRKDPDPLVLKALGKIYYDAGDFAKAGELFELGRKTDPSDPAWLQELARVYAQNNDKEKQISVLTDLVPTDADDLDRRVRLARLLVESGKHREAEKYARQALEIDVTSKEARELLFQALRVQKKTDELAKMKKLLEG
jgi:tetratricopeptide (TPR) repeat protein